MKYFFDSVVVRLVPFRWEGRPCVAGGHTFGAGERCARAKRAARQSRAASRRAGRRGARYFGFDCGFGRSQRAARARRPSLCPAPVAPIAPADGNAPAALLTPASVNNPLVWQWSVAAQKKTKAQKKAEHEAAEAKIFNTDPLPTTPYNPKNNPPVAPAVGTPTGAPAPGVAPQAPAGRSELVAFQMRRILLGQGYRNVQVSAPESGAVLDAINKGLLSRRVVDELKRALAQLKDGADPNALILAGRSASRIAQATGYRALVAFYVAPPEPVTVVGRGDRRQRRRVGEDRGFDGRGRRPARKRGAVQLRRNRRAARSLARNRRRDRRARARRRAARLARQLQFRPRGSGLDPLQRRQKRLGHRRRPARPGRNQSGNRARSDARAVLHFERRHSQGHRSGCRRRRLRARDANSTRRTAKPGPKSPPPTPTPKLLRGPTF